MKLRSLACSALSVLALAGCSSKSDGAPAAAATDDAGAEPTPIGGDRPVNVFVVPRGYDASKPAPLVLILHGYGASGVLQNAYFGLSDLADQEGFFVAAPDGLVDPTGHRYWNATDVCCDFGGTPVDDVKYLGDVVAQIQARYAIDPKRIYAVGHSNGGFMAHDLACNRADLFAAIVSLAGATWKDQSKCQPTAPVGVLQIHGTADDTVPYDGGTLPGSIDTGTHAVFPGAKETVADWATKNGCGTPLADQGAPFDLVVDVAGAETQASAYPGCPANAAAELWTMTGAGHIPGPGNEMAPRIWAFLKSHAKN